VRRQRPALVCGIIQIMLKGGLMSVEAYVFIECEHAKSKEVLDKLVKIGGVKEARIVTGPYDLIALVAASNFKVLGDVVISKIQLINHVKRTLTNVVIE
jgi:DNA-binding Lrp family transcriptional regulator